MAELSDDFTGNNGDPPDSSKWNDEYIILKRAEIQSNKLRLSHNVNGEHCNCGSSYLLQGDFDVQIDFDASSFSSGYIYLQVMNPDNGYYLRMQWNYNPRYYTYWNGAGGSGNSYVSTSDTSGKLRIVRSGSNITGYYWNGSSWSTVVPAKNIGTGDMYVRLFLGCWDSNTSTVDYDNYTVTADQIAYPSTPVLSDDFTGNNGDPPDSSKWGNTYYTLSNAEIQENKLQLSHSDNEGSMCPAIFKLSGDFDLQIDFEIITRSNPNGWRAYFDVINPDNDYYLQMLWDWNGRIYTYWNGAGGSGNSYVDISNYFGKLRIVRSGSNITGYYSFGSWSTVVPAKNIGTGDMCVRIRTASWTSTSVCTADFDNFKVTEGTIIYVTSTDTFDGKIIIKSSDTDLLDGKAVVKSTTTDLLDGKAIIKSSDTDLFDGKMIVKDIASAVLLDGKVIIKDITANLFDGKITIEVPDCDIGLLDGKIIISIGTFATGTVTVQFTGKTSSIAFTEKASSMTFTGKKSKITFQ